MAAPVKSPPIAKTLASDTLKPRAWTASEFERAYRLGLFSSDERLELLDGVITTMSPYYEPHYGGVHRAEKLILAVFGDKAYVRNQGPLALSKRSRPLPDVVVVRGSVSDYEVESPKPSDVLILIEISDSTLQLDRKVKSRIYAKAGIIEYWIVNIVERQLEVFRQPNLSSGSFATSEILTIGQSIRPVKAPIDSEPLNVADLFPSASSLR